MKKVHREKMNKHKLIEKKIPLLKLRLSNSNKLKDLERNMIVFLHRLKSKGKLIMDTQ